MSEIKDSHLEKWTNVVNAIVDVLKIEMEGGFLEDTTKYKDDSEETIYRCLRAVAVQIISIKEIAIVDRKARLPIRFLHPDDKPNTSYELAQEDMLKAGFKYRIIEKDRVG